jgi:L-2-hydroxyglutarate oxidase LhgO
MNTCLGGEWLDIEDCDGTFDNLRNCSGCTSTATTTTTTTPCPRSKSRNSAAKPNGSYDAIIIGGGCCGATVARELSKFRLSILWVEAADDVSQGATKGNSGIVHAGYDDTPGTNRAKYCWNGNQMFAQLDRELRFGYQRNGSLVLAFTQEECDHLQTLKQRGETNGVQRLEIINQQQLLEMEPNVNPQAIAALYSPDAGNVIPYEFTIALAENAVDNGVELRIRRKVTALQFDETRQEWTVSLQHWEPQEYLNATRHAWTRARTMTLLAILLVVMLVSVGMELQLVLHDVVEDSTRQSAALSTGMIILATALLLVKRLDSPARIPKTTPLTTLVNQAGTPAGKGGSKVPVKDMLVGGSGANAVMNGTVVQEEQVKARYVINCAGGASDEIANMIGDTSFVIKPRLGDYLLLNRNQVPNKNMQCCYDIFYQISPSSITTTRLIQGYLAKHTLFPCPDPVLGKGVLVQTTLWGNLILGPTARDVYKPQARDMSDASVQEYILSKCKQLVPYFDPKETFHAFCGARAKNSTGDWVIGPSTVNSKMIHVAGIDSPGLAGSPAIAVDVVKMLEKDGLEMVPDPTFNPNRAPIISPKRGMQGLKMGPVGKNDSDGIDETKMASNVICKCEKVTELEVVRAMRRSLPIDSSQGIRKRTRAGMGHCQGDPDNYNCEARVRAIIARENGVPIDQVGGRPWPATSTLPERWLDEQEKQILQERMDA